MGDSTGPAAGSAEGDGGGSSPPESNRTALYRRNGQRLVVMGTTRGLLADAAEVTRRISTARPRVVAVTVNPAELRSLRLIARTRPEGFDLKKREDVEELAGLMWDWECGCGRSNPPEALRCAGCGKPREGPQKTGVSGRGAGGARSAHGAADNIWAESDTPPAKPKGPDAPEFGIGDILSSHDELFMTYLSAFGEVRFPSPSYLAAVAAAKSAGSGLVGVDLEEEAFTDLHLREVGYMDLMRSGRAMRKLERKGLEASTPARFVTRWDAAVNRPGGFGRVEAVRVAHWADKLSALCLKKGSVFCVTAIERMADLGAALEGKGFAKAGQ